MTASFSYRVPSAHDLLDPAPPAVRPAVERRVRWLILAGRDDRPDMVAAKPPADAVVAVPLISGQAVRPTPRTGVTGPLGPQHNDLEHLGVMPLARRDPMAKTIPWPSQTRWTLVPNPPRERPSA